MKTSRSFIRYGSGSGRYRTCEWVESGYEYCEHGRCDPEKGEEWVTDFVVQIAAIERLNTTIQVLLREAKRVDDIPLDYSSSRGCQRHDGDIGELFTKCAEPSIFWSERTAPFLSK